MARTLKWLEELLDEKTKQLDAAASANEELRRLLEYQVDWMLHTHNESQSASLPAPRIEMRIVANTEWSVETSVLLVLKERGGDATGVPLGYSKRSGSGLLLKAYPTAGELPSAFVSDLPSILNDACYYIEQTSLPGYVVLDAERRYRIHSLRPLVLVAIPSDGPG